MAINTHQRNLAVHCLASLGHVTSTVGTRSGNTAQLTRSGAAWGGMEGEGVSYRQLAAKDKRDKSQSLIWHTHTHTHVTYVKCQLSL